MSMIDYNSINPYIRVAMRSVLTESFSLKSRALFDYELIYIEKGNMLFIYDGISYNCDAGQFILIRPGISHEFKTIKSKLYQPHFHFDLVYTNESKNIPVSYKDITDMTPAERCMIAKDLFEKYPRTPFVDFSDKDIVLDLFFRAIDCPNNLTRKALLTQIISMLITDNFPDCFSYSEHSIYNIAQHLKDYIDSGQGLTDRLSDFEKIFSYNKFYMEKQFKKHYGISLMNYKNNKKMAIAKKMLETESVSLVSEKLGYNSIYSFSRAFKNHFGICASAVKNINEDVL